MFTEIDPLEWWECKINPWDNEVFPPLSELFPNVRPIEVAVETVKNPSFEQAKSPEPTESEIEPEITFPPERRKYYEHNLKICKFRTRWTHENADFQYHGNNYD